jgi:hypothetical protein
MRAVELRRLIAAARGRGGTDASPTPVIRDEQGESDRINDRESVEQKGECRAKMNESEHV